MWCYGWILERFTLLPKSDRALRVASVIVLKPSCNYLKVASRFAIVGEKGNFMLEVSTGRAFGFFDRC